MLLPTGVRQQPTQGPIVKRGVCLILCLSAGTAQAQTVLRHPLVPDRQSRPGRAAVDPARLFSQSLAEPQRLMTRTTIQQKQGGPVVVEKGVVAVDKMTQPLVFMAQKPAPAAAPPVERMGRRLLLRLQVKGAPDSPHPVSLWLKEPRVPSISLEIDKGIAEGRLATLEDVDREHRRLLEERGQDAARAQDPVAAAVSALGGTVTRRCKHQYCLVAQLTDAALSRLLATSADIVRADAPGRLEEFAVDGEAVERGSQFVPLYSPEPGFQGQDGRFARLTQVEQRLPDSKHVGFFTDPSLSTNRLRIIPLWNGDCSAYLGDEHDRCELFKQYNVNAHATPVAGILVGDLLDGQDPNLNGALPELRRSGYARAAAELTSYGIGFVGEADAGDRLAGALEEVLDGHSPYGRIINMSGGDSTSDPDCWGQGNVARRANDLYEAGSAFFAAAGNSCNHVDVNDCNAGEPATALGVFAVGSHGYFHFSNGSCSTQNGYVTTTYWKPEAGEREVRLDPISEFSSRGGTASQGLRSIIGLTAFGCRDLMFKPGSAYEDGSVASCGTSYAAPTVAAFAARFRQFFRERFSDEILDPGLLYANMLLMGDRQTQDSGRRANSGFDNVWGAGRLRARQFWQEGMDAPWKYLTGSVCVGQGEKIPLDAPWWEPDADAYKVAIWWYDAAHENGGPIDDMDLYLMQRDGQGNEKDIVASASSTDNKEFVFHATVDPTVSVYPLIHGYRVTNGTPGCPGTSTRVFYAYFLEDGDRDDADGPSMAVRPEADAPQSVPGGTPLATLALIGGLMACALRLPGMRNRNGRRAS